MYSTLMMCFHNKFDKLDAPRESDAQSLGVGVGLMLIYCGERMKQFSIHKGVTISKTVIINQLGIRKKTV